MKTYSARPSDVQRQWLVVDAEGRTLGRLATQVSMVLRGKHKAIYTPHIDTGDHVVVINASKVVLTGRKPEDKRYFHHTMYPGGASWTSIREVMAKHPEARGVAGGAWHDAQDQAGPCDGEEAQGVRGARAPARGAAAGSLEPRVGTRRGMATEISNKPLTGRRKQAVARVQLLPGNGKHQVNDRTPLEYLTRETLVQTAFHALVVANAEGKFNVVARVHGGGLTGQAGAVRLAVARALVREDESLRAVLGRAGLLTRDPRMKERKKYGQPGARKRFQFSKR